MAKIKLCPFLAINPDLNAVHILKLRTIINRNRLKNRGKSLNKTKKEKPRRLPGFFLFIKVLFDCWILTVPADHDREQLFNVSQFNIILLIDQYGLYR